MDLAPYLKFLDISASSATIVVIGLSPILYINRAVLLNSDGLEVGFGLGGLVVIFGLAVAVLIVRSLQLFLRALQHWGKKEIERRERQHLRDAEIEEIRKNLRTLSQTQKAQLVWILRNGTERVDLPVDYGLISKGILKSIKASNRLVEVDPWVWDNREDVAAGEPTPEKSVAFPPPAIIGCVSLDPD